MSIKIFITKKTHATTQPVGKKIQFVEFTTDLEIGQFISINRRKIIFLKDALLNRENLSVTDLESKVSAIKNSIDGVSDLPTDFIEPIGIKTHEQIFAKQLRESEANQKKLDKAKEPKVESEQPKSDTEPMNVDGVKHPKGKKSQNKKLGIVK